MIEEGLVLMGAGMATVGLFLTTMVVVMYASSAILKRFDKTPPQSELSGGLKSAKDELAEIAVAIAAVKSHIS